MFESCCGFWGGVQGTVRDRLEWYCVPLGACWKHDGADYCGGVRYLEGYWRPYGRMGALCEPSGGKQNPRTTRGTPQVTQGEEAEGSPPRREGEFR